MVSQTPRRNVAWPFNPRAIRPRPAFMLYKLRRWAVQAAYIVAASAGLIALCIGAAELIAEWL